MMQVTCDYCGKMYKVDENKIKGEKARLKCRSCEHIIIVTKPDPAAAASDAPVVSRSGTRSVQEESMMKTRVAVMWLTLCMAPGAGLADDAELPEFEARALRAHMEFLADDLLEGRDTGTRGYALAARYVASMFAMAGLRPAGDDGSWFQYFDTVEGRLVEDSATLVLRTESGQEIPMLWQQDYVLGGSYVDPDTRIDAPMTFVGYGVTAPELGYDDYGDSTLRRFRLALNAELRLGRRAAVQPIDRWR